MNSNQRIIKKNIEVLYPELSYIISGICFDIHNKRGRFCKEKQYSDEFENTLKIKNISYKKEFSVEIDGKSSGDRVDFIVNNQILVEFKAKKFLAKEDYYQTKRYLEALGMKLGLIVNFRDIYIKPKRILASHS